MSTPTTNETGSRMFALEKSMQIPRESCPSAEQIVKDAEAFIKFVSPPKSNIVGLR